MASGLKNKNLACVLRRKPGASDPPVCSLGVEEIAMPHRVPQAQ